MREYNIHAKNCFASKNIISPSLFPRKKNCQKPSTEDKFSSTIGKHSSDSSRSVKVVRHVHRVAPFDIFSRVHRLLSREIRLVRGGDSRRQKRKTSISFLETSTKRRSTVTGRALSGEFRWKTG